MVVVTTGTGRSPSGPSKSKSVTHTVDGSHHFTITGYSLAKGMGVGKYIASDTFTVGSYKWAIYFYPDGKNQEDNSQYVSLFIALASEGTDVRALFELTMLDQSDRNPPVHKVHSHFDRSLESGPYTLKYRGSMWGYKRFYRRQALETSVFLRNDCLNITCKVGVVMSATEGPPRPLVMPPPSPTIGRDFGAILEDEQHCDVSFLVGDEVIMAHKLILSARSEYFRANFYGPMRERRENPLPIEEMEPAVFRAMLQFIYTDSLPERGPYALTNVMAQHLLAAADRYGLERLRMMCEAKLCETVDTETVATTLALAEQHNAVQLKTICLRYAAQNLAAVMETEGFEHLSESCPSLQKELLRVVAGVDAAKDVGAGSSRWSIEAQAAAVWEDVGDGTDAGGRRVKQRLGHA